MDHYSLCRECGAYVNEATAEELHGLCGVCAFKARPVIGEIADVSSEPRAKYTPTFVEPTEPWPGDTDVIESSDDDPIRRAIDRAAADWALTDNNQRSSSNEDKSESTVFRER